MKSTDSRRSRWPTVGVSLAILSIAADRPVNVLHARGAPAAAAATSELLNTYCVTCHNGRLKTAGLEIDGLDAAHVADHAQQWEKIAAKLRTGEMPPPGRPRPDRASSQAVAAAVEQALDAAAAATPQPGRVPVHRLNRTEYANAIRDLLGVEIDARALLSSDNSDQEGFDNIASTLSVSPALLENYLSAARAISRLAVGDLARHPVIDSYKISKALVQDERVDDDLPFGSQGGALIRYYFPLDAEYSIKVLLRRQEYDYIVGMGERHQLDFRLDGVRLKRFAVGGEAKGMTAPENFAGNTQGDPEFEEYMHTADAHLELRVPVKAGLHEVGVSFVRRLWEPEGVLQPPQTGFGRTTNEYYHGNPAVEVVLIGGPYGATDAGDTAARRRVFTCRPQEKTAAGSLKCARQILSTLATRAYRRPVTDPEIDTLLEFFKAGDTEGGFERGIQRGLERMLAAPSFLFRVEREPPGIAAGTTYSVGDLDVASRLSFFLWSSIPDDELRDAAVRGALNDRAALERQVQRMLRDPRASALVDNFAARWLELGKLAGAVPDTELYPEFDENLRRAMEQETKLFIGSQLRENRSVMDLVTADYSFLNARLATHYGIPDVYGTQFRRVTFTDRRRGGLLGQSSILTVTSYPNRTSVTMRGRWLLANLLGSPPPPPPADVPALQDAGANGQPRSLRARMELHRANPACASCHRRMDPLGFALENFDAVGKWRTSEDRWPGAPGASDAGVPIDASAVFPDGSTFEGIAGLRELFVSHREDFVRTLSGKLLAYAIGRGLDYHDLPAVRGIVRDAAAADYSWSAIVSGIVRSTPFRVAVAGGE